MSMDEVYSRFAARDPLLLVALHSGDPEITGAITRLLRLTPLSCLAAHQATLVDVLSGIPELHGRLRSTWDRQDPELAARLFAWADQRRTRSLRAGGDEALPDDDLATV